MRTTALQVSGYKFLRRRLELALVIGDPRMAHDPLRSQRRALIVGMLLALLLAGGAGMMALLRPEPNVGQEMLVSDEHGVLHVRLEDGFHPVTNVASARLVLGQPVVPQKTTSEHLSEHPLGDPMGVDFTPGLTPAEQREWLLCDDQVHAVDQVTASQHAVARSGEQLWLINGSTVYLVPEGSDRALGAEVAEIAPGTVAGFHRGLDVILPHGDSGLPAPYNKAGQIYTAGERTFVVGYGGIAEIAGARKNFVLGQTTGLTVSAPLAELLELPAVTVAAAVPNEDVEWFAPSAGEGTVCAAEDGVVWRAGDHPDKGFHGPRGTSAIQTERGYFLVSAAGTRFPVATVADARALGFEEFAPVPWRMIQPLEEGPLLSAGSARQTRATMNTTDISSDSAIATE